jgi:heme/copper-type cytochrome/quinol oxidase subunit 3
MSDSDTFTRSDETSRVGMAIFLGAWAMMFCALLFAYFDVRLHAPIWPPPGDPRPPRDVPALATLVLFTASFTLRRARTKSDSLRSPIIMNLVFLALQLLVWRDLYRAGLRASSPFGAVFWTLTIFHGAHIVVATIGLALCSMLRNKLHNWTLFQHALLLSWLLIFVSVYLV